METPFTPTCSSCGGPLTGKIGYCPFCRYPLSPLFADPAQEETCRQFLLEMEKTINDVPPLPGWGLLIFWFGAPLAALAACVLLIQGLTGWLAGLAAAVLLFGILTMLAAYLRDRIRQQQYTRLVRPALVEFLQDSPFQWDELAWLAQQDKDLCKSSLLPFLSHPGD
jgi:hypothetical protein